MFDWLSRSQFLHLSVLRWLTALLIAGAGGTLSCAILRMLAARLRTLAVRTASSVLSAISSALERSSSTLLLVLFALIGTHALHLPQTTQTWLDRVAFLVAGLQIGLWANAAIQVLTRDRLGHAQAGPGNPVVTAILGWFARIVAWATIVLAVLGNMGLDITALVTSLGIGGVAIALALQNILGDLFASLSIGLDKPFAIGDFIAFGDQLGTVEHVGVKTTRIRSLQGEQLVIGNADLLGKTIHNYGRMSTRRIVFTFGIALDTPHQRVQQVIAIVHAIIAGIENINLDRAHFKGFGESSLDFEVVYIVQDAGYGVYMDVQQRINLELMARLQAIDVHFAMPLRGLRHPVACPRPPERVAEQ